MICKQEGCKEKATFRYTWPGKDEAGACDEHAPQLAALANAIGMRLQLIPLPVEETARDEG